MPTTDTTGTIQAALHKLADQVKTEHQDFADAIRVERAIKVQLLTILGDELLDCGAAIATNNEVILSRVSVLPDRASGAREVMLELCLEMTGPVIGTDEQTWWIRRTTRYAESKDVVDTSATPHDIVHGGRFPIEGIFAEAVRVLQNQTRGFKTQRTADIRAVSMVLEGVAGAWKRRGGVE